MMHRKFSLYLWLVVLLVGVFLSASAGTEVTRQSFTHRGQLELSGAGPFYQLTLPLTVYQGIEHGLSDLRVFNGQDEIVPHAILRPVTSSVTQSQKIAIPLFPIIGTHGQEGASTQDRKSVV